MSKLQDKDGADKSIEKSKGSTISGGSNHGQGSKSLAGDAYNQGQEQNKGGKL